jgi:Uncharacterized protein conserved in bacteria (DUF2325)
LLRRLEAENTQTIRLTDSLRQLEEQLRLTKERNAKLAKENDVLRREISLLETVPAIDETDDADVQAPGPDLSSLTLVYVGGWPKLTDQLKAETSKRGGVMLTADGGVDDNIALLPGLVSRADAVLFPVDCISHDAATKAKKLARRLGKPFAPLRTASLGSFIAAIAAGDHLRQRHFDEPAS